MRHSFKAGAFYAHRLSKEKWMRQINLTRFLLVAISIVVAMAVTRELRSRAVLLARLCSKEPV